MKHPALLCLLLWLHLVLCMRLSLWQAAVAHVRCNTGIWGHTVPAGILIVSSLGVLLAEAQKSILGHLCGGM